jgi:putative transposase
MPDSEPLHHTTWDCTSHVVFLPKYRRKALSHAWRRHLGEVFRALAAQTACQMEEGHWMAAQVHLRRSMPPQSAVAQGVGWIKGKAASHLARTFLGRRQHSPGHPGWARGDAVSTGGSEEAVSREYLRPHEAEERRLDQRDLWEAGPPVGGSQPHRVERFHLFQASGFAGGR